MRIAAGLALDAGLLALLARRNHRESATWPFKAAMASTRLAIATSVGGTRLGIRNGLRFWLARAGTVPAFIVVATDFLGAGLQGRRFAPARPMDARG